MPEPKPPPVVPGDIIQITQAGHPQFMALLVVEQTQRRFIGCRLWASEEDGFAYVRLQHGQYVLCGTAVLVSAEIARARKDAERTIKALMAERGKA